MSTFDRTALWFERIVLAGATFVMAMIAWRNLHDPVGATQSLDIVLRSPSAATIARVGLGGFPLGFAIALGGCAISAQRLMTGMWLLLTVVGAVMMARVVGLLFDGVTPYNLRLLAPEVVMVALSVVGVGLERRRIARSV
jgi:hypothetical protein